MAFLTKQLGLNQPVWERFGHYVANTVQGHLGYSWQFQEPVATLVAQRVGFAAVGTTAEWVAGLWTRSSDGRLRP